MKTLALAYNTCLIYVHYNYLQSNEFIIMERGSGFYSKASDYIMQRKEIKNRQRCMRVGSLLRINGPINWNQLAHKRRTRDFNLLLRAESRTLYIGRHDICYKSSIPLLKIDK